MSTRKRTAAEWPRMKVRGARRREEASDRAGSEIFERMADVLAWAGRMFGDAFDAWQQHITATLLLVEMRAEEARATRELGEELAVSPALVEDVIAQTLQHTAGEPTDWAIARANISALAAMTKI